MELPPASALEVELEKELEALRKDPSTYANYIRSNRQNLYKGNNLELLKDDLKTKVCLACSSFSFSFFSFLFSSLLGVARNQGRP